MLNDHEQLLTSLAKDLDDNALESYQKSIIAMETGDFSALDSHGYYYDGCDDCTSEWDGLGTGDCWLNDNDCDPTGEEKGHYKEFSVGNHWNSMNCSSNASTIIFGGEPPCGYPKFIRVSFGVGSDIPSDAIINKAIFKFHAAPEEEWIIGTQDTYANNQSNSLEGFVAAVCLDGDGLAQTFGNEEVPLGFNKIDWNVGAMIAELQYQTPDIACAVQDAIEMDFYGTEVNQSNIINLMLIPMQPGPFTPIYDNTRVFDFDNATLDVWWNLIINEDSTGGVVCGGEALDELIQNNVGDGGVVCGGDSDDELISNNSSEGGVVCGGDSDDELIGNNVGEGGVVGGGEVIDSVTVNEFGDGGVVGGGHADDFDFIEGEGGVLVGGNSIPSIYINTQGGIEVGGESENSSFLAGEGGVEVGGEYVDSVVVNESGDGGIVGGGDGDDNLFSNKKYITTDPNKFRIIVNGSASLKFSLKYIASGGINVGSVDDEVDVNFDFSTDLTLLWKLNKLIVKDLTFLWNTGELQIFWYRVIGKQSAKCEPLEPCCQKIITNIHARTPAELCDKLRARRFQFRIDSVQKFARPAENTQFSNGDCDDLIPVEICEIPACADFCVDFEPQVIMGVQTTVQVDAFLNYESSGNLFIGGSAGIYYERIVPNFPYETNGGVFVAGTVDYISSGYSLESEGGIYITGSAKQKSSAWNYVGGEWPLIVDDLGGSEVESLEEVITDVHWGAVEYVLDDDLSPTQVDLSFNKTSEFLIVRGFNFNIPDTSDILGIIAKVDRSANNVGVVDDSVYLLVGDEIISDNLANISDWPLIQSEWWYGNTGYDFDSNKSWVSDDSDFPKIEPSDLNDSEFGFAIRIKSKTNLSDIFAYIRYISMSVYYQNEGEDHILKVGGESKVVSVAYNYEISDGLNIGGMADFKIGRFYLASGSSSDISIGGNHERHFDYESDSGIILGGGSTYKPSWQLIESLGGASVGGEIKITPYLEESLGGSFISGISDVNHTNNYTYESSGSIELMGAPILPETVFNYQSEGNIVLGGEADYKSSSYHFVSNGEIFVLGGAIIQGSDLGVQQENIGADFKVLEMNFDFGDFTSEEFDAPSETVEQCNCPEMSLITNVSHNMARDNRLSQFLVRNNFTIPRIMLLRYNIPNDSWQANLHYRGVSSINSNLEDWNLIFELRCTNYLGGIELGRTIWQFSTQIFVEDAVTGESFDTRILVSLIPDSLCLNGALDFTIDYNTELDFVSVSPNSVIYNNILYDGIRLFKNRSWMQNPILTFNVSQSGVDALTPRYDARGFGQNRPMRTI